MAIAVIMPKQGQSVETCIITEWSKNPGDAVKVGDVLYSYETDKASFECTAEAEGTLLTRFFESGDEVPVLVNVAVIGKTGEATDSFKPGGAPAAAPAPEEKPAAQPVVAEVKATETKSDSDTETIIVGDIKISPRAKKLAEKLGVFINTIKGSGPEGRIIERDIQAAANAGNRGTILAQQIAKEEGKTPAGTSGIGGRATVSDLSANTSTSTTTTTVSTGEFTIKPLTNIRKIIAKAMVNSLQSAAQLTHHISADARKMLALREQVKAEMAKGTMPNITLNDMVCYAAIKALKKHPEVNGHFLGDSYKLFNNVHLGLAVDTPRGLMVPVLKNADDFNLSGLGNKLKEIANQCKTGSINPELLSSEAGTFTISNLGAFGIEMFTPVLNVPQMAILGVCTITHKPKDIGGGTIAFVPHIGLSLTYDHRALDGAPASAFLKTLVSEIENITL